jgi:hypothetical protein
MNKSLFGPIARIVLRYGVGAVLGFKVGQELAADPDVVMVVALGVGALIEAVYIAARRAGKT